MKIDMSIVNMLIILGIVICGAITVVVEDTLSSIISVAALGSFIALEFLLLHAPDAAIAEGAAGAVLTPVLLLAAFKRVKGGIEE